MRKFIGVSIFFVGLCFAATDAHAIFTLSVAPRRGGQGVRFEAAKPGDSLRNEEVTLSVTSDHAVQYRIIQMVYQPLTNESGNSIPQDALITFSPSTPLGNLRTQLETPVTMGQVPIYTSNTAGDSDNFVLAYNAKIPENQPGGVYHTTITFTAEPVNAASGVSSSTVNMDLRLEIRPDFKITIQNARGGKDLNFGKITKDHPDATEILSFVIESNIGSPYRIIQQVTEPVTAQNGTALEEGSILFSASGSSKGTLKTSASPILLSETSMVIYTSSDKGDGDAIQIQVILNPSLKQKAGIYSGNLSYRIESNAPSFSNQIFNIPIRVEIESVFYLDVEVEKGSNLHFGTFKTGEEKEEKKVVLTVHSNLGEPYQVSQIVSRNLTNSEGVFIPKDHFTFFGSDAQTGLLIVMSPQAVSEGESMVFTSNKLGDPEEFTLNYSLAIPNEAKAGNYSSDIKYSITTL